MAISTTTIILIFIFVLGVGSPILTGPEYFKRQSWTDDFSDLTFASGVGSRSQTLACNPNYTFCGGVLFNYTEPFPPVGLQYSCAVTINFANGVGSLNNFLAWLVQHFLEQLFRRLSWLPVTTLFFFGVGSLNNSLAWTDHPLEVLLLHTQEQIYTDNSLLDDPLAQGWAPLIFHWPAHKPSAVGLTATTPTLISISW